METRMLLLTNILDHPLTSRVHFLIKFLEESQISVKIFDVSFYHKNQRFLCFLRNLFAFPSEAINSYIGTTIHLPSLPLIFKTQESLKIFINFLYSIFAFFLVGIVTKSMEYNVIVVSDPLSAFIALPAMKKGTFFVYEDLDYFEDLKTGQFRRKAFSFLEKFALRHADLVVSVSEPLLKRAHQLNREVILVPNGTDLQSFLTPQETSREPIMVYAGSMDEWAGLTMVIEAFALIRKRLPWVMMKIIGDGKERRKLETMVENLSLQDSVFFTGRLPYKQMAASLCNCSVGIAAFKPCNAAAFASPLKLFDYMSAGLPIIATDIGEIGKIIKESGSGFAIKWNIIEFAEAAEELLTKRNLWLTFHENGLQYVKKYSWDNLFSYWLQEIRSRI